MRRIGLVKNRFFGSLVMLAGLASALLFGLVEGAAAKDTRSPEGKDTVWAIGIPDGSWLEFASDERDKLTYTVGVSVPGKDFAARQRGSVSVEPQVPSRESPYTITFDLADTPREGYELVLDLVFLTAAPEQIEVEINGQKGIFPVQAAPKQDADSDDGNTMLLAKQRLVVPVAASVLRPKGNSITLVPLGVGALNYDALSLRRAPGSGPSLASPQIVPTIFFRKDATGLKEVCWLLVPFEKRFRKGNVTLRVGATSLAKTLTSGNYDFGILKDSIEIPALAEPTEATVRVSLDGRSQRARQQLAPAKHWKLYICPRVHNDLGYTHIQPQVDELDNRNTDTVLDILAQYPFYKFNFETAWLLDNYLDSRPAEYRDRLLEHARQGRVGVNALYFHLLTELCSGEELHRSLYFAYHLHKKYGSRFNSACLTDVPSGTWFLPSLLRDVGIRVFANASNQTRAPILSLTDLNETSPFYWEGMNGERVMVWMSRNYWQLKRLVGGDINPLVSNYEYLKRAVPQFLLRYAREDYPPDAVMAYGAYTDNAVIPQNGDADLIERWNQEYAFPKLIVATDDEYFAYVEKHFADRLPVHRGDGGAYWEDGAGSTSHATKLNQQAKQILPAAETIASFATLLDPHNLYPAAKFRALWNDVLFYDEHTWGAHSSIRQPDREFVTRQWEIKENYATRANVEARRLLSRSLYRLFQKMAVESDTIFAVNLQPWTRTGPLEVDIDKGTYLVDLAENRPVKLDVVLRKDAWQKVRFLADDVPAMGYKGYGLRRSDSLREPAPAAQVSPGGTIENQYYRLEVDMRTGGLKSLYDKTAGKELVDQGAPYKLNQFLYVSGGADTLIIDNIHGRSPADLKTDSPISASIVESVRTPLGQRLVVETHAKNTLKIQSEYNLYDGLRRVDILNVLRKEEVREKEAVYFAFPFAAGNPSLEYQIQNGWVRPNEDQLPGACREWFTTQNLVHVRDGAFSVAWATPDAPLITLTDINRGKWPKHLEIHNAHVFSYVMNNYWFTNYKAEQGGDFAFRYYITSGNELTREGLSRFDADTRTPVFSHALLSTFAAPVTGEGKPLSAVQGSLMTLDAPNLQTVVLKAAEDGDGYVLRLQETAGRSGEGKVAFPTLNIREAYLSNGVEEPQRKLETTPHTIVVPYKPNQYVTIRLSAEAMLMK